MGFLSCFPIAEGLYHTHVRRTALVGTLPADSTMLVVQSSGNVWGATCLGAAAGSAPGVAVSFNLGSVCTVRCNPVLRHRLSAAGLRSPVSLTSPQHLPVMVVASLSGSSPGDHTEPHNVGPDGLEGLYPSSMTAVFISKKTPKHLGFFFLSLSFPLRFSPSPQPSCHLPQMRKLSHQFQSIIFTEKDTPTPHKNKQKTQPRDNHLCFSQLRFFRQQFDPR